MRLIVVIASVVFMSGCATRECPPLPNPPAQADFNTMSQYATTVATLYGQCAGGAKQ